ncbi:unnamed protein product [Heterobilharzia americana]|nr:unnamed protein product [Heterobilharzia americana]
MVFRVQLFLLTLFGVFSLCPADGNYTYFNVSGCMAFFSRSISVKFVIGKVVTIIPISPSSMSLSSLSECTDTSSVLAFTAKANGIQDLDISLRFTKSGRYWSVSESSVNITCQSESDSCVNVTGYPLNIRWAEAPIGLGYKCTKPPVAPVLLPAGSDRSVSVQFYSVQIEPFGVKDGVFGDVSDCVGYFSIGVWSSLIVSILLVSILTYGLVMLASIQPSEIYEDPKKKMIQLGADN